MSRPLKLTKLKLEENQPPLEAYITDLITTQAPIMPASGESLIVMPANNNEDVTGVTSVHIKETAQCETKKEETK